MRMVVLFARIFAISLQRELAHRANLLFAALTTAIGVGASIATLGVLFSRVQTLAGWRLGELIVLLGLYQVVSGLLDTFIQPNLVWFAQKVKDGTLDDLLLQPVSSLFSASLGSSQPWSLAQVVLGCAVVVAGLGRLGGDVTLSGALLCLLVLAAGVAITWATRLLVASTAFWSPYHDPTVMYSAFWQLGRYPVDVYHPLVRRLLTYAVPVAFVSTFPALELTRGGDPGLALAGLVAACAMVAAAAAVWHVGLRRYTGATS